MTPHTDHPMASGADTQDVPRSNVVPASNVFVRDETAPAHRDATFRLHVRGKEAIRELLENLPGMIDWSRSLGGQKLPVLSDREEAEVRELVQREPSAEVRFALTRGQEAQVRGLRCRCGRVDFGQKRLPNGQLKWGYLWQFGGKCLCERDDDGELQD